MLSCNGLVLNYTIIMYNKSKSKICTWNYRWVSNTASCLIFFVWQLVAVSYMIYRYEDRLNGMANAVVLISYPENAFHNLKALCEFICTNVSIITIEILDAYMEQWQTEMFFCQSKEKLALDKYQILTAHVNCASCFIAQNK